MNNQHQLEQALNQLRNITGLPLEINLSQDSDSEALARQVLSLCNSYEEANSVDAAYRRFLISSMPTEDFMSYAARMHIKSDMQRGLFLVQANRNSIDDVVATLKNIFSDTSSVIFTIRQDTVVIIREATGKKPLKLKELAHEYLNILHTELMIQVSISYGRISEHLETLSDSYREAEQAMKIGTIFYPDVNVYGFSELGVGLLIHDLPEETCINYIRNNVGERFLSTDSIFFEREVLETADCFLRCNLNIAETARQLHVHRNTLLYRLEQIYNETGLDIRKFNAAMTFRLCLLILHYLKQNDK